MKRYCYGVLESLIFTYFAVLLQELRQMQHQIQSSVLYKTSQRVNCTKFGDTNRNHIYMHTSDRIRLPVLMSGCVTWSPVIRHHHGLCLGTWKLS
jgi:hypothetical protein